MKSKSKRIAGYILLAVLVLVGGVAIYIYKEYNRKVKDTASLKTDFSLTAKILVDEFEKMIPWPDESTWIRLSKWVAK